jgi:hypothetical protein
MAQAGAGLQTGRFAESLRVPPKIAALNSQFAQVIRVTCTCERGHIHPDGARVGMEQARMADQNAGKIFVRHV